MTEKRFRKVLGLIEDNDGSLLDLTEIEEMLNSLNDENEQLKHDSTVLIQANQDYRRENEQLRQQVDYIQNSITEHIKHQKTELGQKALKEIIQDYNDWLIGHE